WRHMGDARIEIEESLASPASSTSSAEPPKESLTAPAKLTRRHVLAYGAASIGLAAAGLGGGLWLGGRRQTTQVPSFRRITFRRGVIRSARFAPDGETILYSALWDGDRCRVHQVRVDGPESGTLELPDGNVLAVSRSGEVAVSLGRHQDGV